MNYKNQILKQFANGGYDKKTYMDLVRKKTNKTYSPTNENININTKETVQKNNDNIEFAIDPSDFFTEQPKTLLDKNIADDVHISKIKLLENKISELEDYVVEMASEIEIHKNDQKNIITVLNKLSDEISAVKNKIAK